MLLGTPVATNSEGAEGIDLIDGVHAVVEDNLNSFIDKVEALTNSFELQEKMRLTARTHIENICAIDKVISSQMELYQQVIKGK
jgi:hypothetical protein